MKKFIALLITAVMSITMFATAFAEETTECLEDVLEYCEEIEDVVTESSLGSDIIEELIEETIEEKPTEEVVFDAAQEVSVYVSATGTKYHSINNCGTMNPDKATELSVEEAEAQGYTPCQKCCGSGEDDTPEELPSSKTGFETINGERYFVINGVIDQTAMGLVLDPDNTSDWYYVANGKVCNITSLAQYDGAWFYIVDGRLDTTYSGYVSYDGGLFFVGAGRIMTEVSGLAQDPNGTDWYFLANGQAQIQYTGLALYDGAWFYVINGKFAETFSGVVEYDGAQFDVDHGMVTGEHKETNPRHA